MSKNTRHYWVICMEDYDVDWDQITVREIRDAFIEGLKANMKYISVINVHGENMYEEEGHKTCSLDDEPWIEVFDDEGNLDLEETANKITRDFILNCAVIAMRFEGDCYDELGKDKSWLDDILDEE